MLACIIPDWEPKSIISSVTRRGPPDLVNFAHVASGEVKSSGYASDMRLHRFMMPVKDIGFPCRSKKMSGIPAGSRVEFFSPRLARLIAFSEIVRLHGLR